MDTTLCSTRAATEERSLRERFRGGDEAAFDEVVARHRTAVYGMARRVLGSHEDADEAAQLTFVRAWKARCRFRGDSSLRTWLIRIVLNVSKSLHVRGPRVEPLGDPERWVDASPGSLERIQREQSRRRVRTAISGLPPRQRETVLLKVFGELTYREVAEVMELTEGAVKAHFHQAVSNLRRLMGNPDD